MTWTVYYDRPTQSWWGYWSDEEGNQIGEAVFEHKRDDLLIVLGALREDRLRALRA